MAEMERQIEMLTRLNQHHPSMQRFDGYAPQPAPYADMGGMQTGAASGLPNQQGSSIEDQIRLAAAAQQAGHVNMSAHRPEPQAPNLAPPPPVQDINSVRDAIDGNLAKILFDHFMQVMWPQAPLVSFPKPMDISALRKEKPTLFGVLMTIASADASPDLHAVIAKPVMSDVTEKLLVAGEKSIELVQCLELLAVWHGRANKWSFFHLYQQNVNAMVVALQMDEPGVKPGTNTQQSAEPGKDVDHAAAFLSFYYLSSM